MSKLTLESIKAEGWLPVSHLFIQTDTSKIYCGYIYSKGDLILEHDEIRESIKIKLAKGKLGSHLFYNKVSTVSSLNLAVHKISH